MLKHFPVEFLLLFLSCAGPTARRGSSVPPTKSMIAYDELIATPAPPADHREPYGPNALQVGELRLPQGRGPVPVVVLIHGGCWRSAYDLAHTGLAASALASAGYAVWVPEYRRVGDAGGGWPGTFDDVGRAIDFLRDLSRRYPRLDTTRVILAGHSAGGQLALWAGSRKASDSIGTDGGNGTPRQPLRVRGVVSLAGITDLARYASPSGCGSAVNPLLGGTAAEQPDRYRAVSPIERVPLGVPVRLVHGANDPIVPLEQSRTLAARMQAAGEQATVTEVAGAGHFDVVAPQSTAWSAVLVAVRSLTGTRR